jgi:hypothetical protein
MDLESEHYRLQAFVRRTTPESDIYRLKTAAEVALQGSNVRLEIVDLDSPTLDAPPETSPSATAPTSTLALALLSPDGQMLNPLAAAASSGSSPVWAKVLDPLVSSPARDRLLESVSQCFGAILLLDGTDTAANEKARATIEESIEQTRAQMRTLPKSIARPPELVRLDTASLARESTLLWSLSLKPQPTVHPRALVLYGRMRWIGPVMNGEEITTRNLVGLLSMIGADCECGLDLQWTLGTRLPVRWSDRTHALAVKGLGFDPENPVVKTEIAAILQRRHSDTGPKWRSSESPEAPKASRSEHARATLNQAEQTTAHIAATRPGPDAELPTPLAWWALSGLAGFVLLASVALIRRARRQL